MAEKVTLKNQRVFKGSGDIYSREYGEIGVPDFPELGIDVKSKKVTITEDNETKIYAFLRSLYGEEYRLCAVKGGYKYSESLTVLEDQDDMGYIKVNEVTEEKATNTFNAFNVNGELIAKIHPLTSTGETASGLRVTMSGGLKNKDDKEHWLMFVHRDTKEGDIVFITRGKNVSGLEIAFDASAVSPVPCSYNAQPIDSDGTLVAIFELPKKFEWETGTVKT